MYVLELPQKAEAPDALEHWVLELRKFQQHLATRYATDITEAKLIQAIQLMNRERSLRRQLADLMTLETPPLTGRQLLDFKSIISGVEADLQQYEHVPLAHGAERVLELIENAGAVVVCMENCTGLKPILEDVDLDSESDPIRAIAKKYYHLPCSVMTPNPRRFQSLRALAAKFRPQCVIELVWQACLTYDVESWQVRKLAEEELRVPYLKITTDYSPSDSVRITARVEALFETVRAKAG